MTISKRMTEVPVKTEQTMSKKGRMGLMAENIMSE
jgi:hypothetical protein